MFTFAGNKRDLKKQHQLSLFKVIMGIFKLQTFYLKESLKFLLAIILIRVMREKIERYFLCKHDRSSLA